MTGMVALSKTESWLTLTGQVAHLGADYSNFIKKMITPGCWYPATRGVVLFCIKFVFQNGSINTSYLYQVIIHRYIGTFLKKCL